MHSWTTTPYIVVYDENPMIKRTIAHTLEQYAKGSIHVLQAETALECFLLCRQYATCLVAAVVGSDVDVLDLAMQISVLGSRHKTILFGRFNFEDKEVRGKGITPFHRTDEVPKLFHFCEELMERVIFALD